MESLFDRAQALEKLHGQGRLPKTLQGRVLACLFYEPSTRTRLSFEAAMQRLGGGIVSVSGAVSSSAAKGESLADTVRVVGSYVDAIVLRHPESGSAAAAAAVSPVPVINAGDGSHEHPTQALLDLWTIKKELGRLKNLHIVMVGDLLYGRTVHSLILLLALYPSCQLTLVSAPTLSLPDEYKNFLRKASTRFEETDRLAEALSSADLVYATRVQKERFRSEAEYEQYKDQYIINQQVMAKLKKQAILMHPLPRLSEIAPEVDADARFAAFRQAKNGLYLRMALLEKILA